jgi:uncharacterized protein
MSTSNTQVVNRMFQAFNAKDLEAALATVSDDTLWTHHGSQKLPSLHFKGKGGVRQFFQTNFTSMQVEYFHVLQLVESGNTVVALGEEKFLMDGRPGHFAQKWVQVYTVVDGLITRMEEFATSAEAPEYQVVE